MTELPDSRSQARAWQRVSVASIFGNWRFPTKVREKVFLAL